VDKKGLICMMLIFCLSSSAIAAVNISREEASKDPRKCALLLAYRITDIYYKPWMLSEVVLKFLGTKDSAVIPEVLSDAEKIARGLDNASYRSDALLEVARGYAKTGEFEKALNIAGSIEALLPRVKTYCLISRLYVEGGKAKEARDVLTVGLRTTEGSTDQNMDVALLETVSAFVNADGLDEAVSVSEKINSGAKKTEARCKVSVAFYRKNDAKQGDIVLAEAETVAKNIEDRIDTSNAYVEISRVYLAKGDKAKALGFVGEAFDISEKIDSKYLKPELLSRISAVYAELGEIDQAIIIAESISDKNYGPRALAEVASYCASTGNKEEANKILMAALGNTKGIRSVYAQANVMADIADSYAGLGDFESELSVSESMKDDYNKPRALARTAVNFSKSDNKEKAQEIFCKAIKAADAIEDDFYKAWALSEISAEYDRAGLAPDRQACTILRKIVNEGK